MRAFALALILLLAAAPAPAVDLVLRNKGSGLELRLLDTPCTHGETLALLKDEWRPKFKNARVRNRQGFIEAYGCWTERDGDEVFVLFQDGSAVVVERSALVDPSV